MASTIDGLYFAAWVKFGEWLLKHLHYVCFVTLIHLRIKPGYKVTEPFFSISTKNSECKQLLSELKGEWHFNYHNTFCAVCFSECVVFSVYFQLHNTGKDSLINFKQNQTFTEVLHKKTYWLPVTERPWYSTKSHNMFKLEQMSIRDYIL